MKIVSNRYSLNKVIAESLNMLDQSLSAVEEKKPYAINDVQRYVHTIKGSFSYFNIQEITQLANDFEQYLEPFYNTETLYESLTVSILERIAAMQIAIECYIDKYDKIIQYKNSANFKTIPVANLDRFGTMLARNHKDLVEAYREQFYFQEIQLFFQMYPNLINDLAIKLNKKIQFKIEGAHYAVPEAHWEELFGQFIHFVRNSADHGIETEAIRLALGKNPVGEIKFSFHLKEQELEIRLSDDGQGIDWKKIAEKDATVKNEADALERIRLGGVSSKNEVSEISGRGVGVSAIFSVVQKWQGKIMVKNEPGKGFTLIITVPLKSSHSLKNVA